MGVPFGGVSADVGVEPRHGDGVLPVSDAVPRTATPDTALGHGTVEVLVVVVA